MYKIIYRTTMSGEGYYWRNENYNTDKDAMERIRYILNAQITQNVKLYQKHRAGGYILIKEF